MPKPTYEDARDVWEEFYKHRFDDWMEEEYRDRAGGKDDRTLEEIEEDEYWANVLRDELRSNK